MEDRAPQYSKASRSRLSTPSATAADPSAEHPENASGPTTPKEPGISTEARAAQPSNTPCEKPSRHS